MKKLILFFLLINSFVFGQKNNYSIAVYADKLKETGKLKLIVKIEEMKVLKFQRNSISVR
jgi:hypothetical protein